MRAYQSGHGESLVSMKRRAGMAAVLAAAMMAAGGAALPPHDPPLVQEEFHYPALKNGANFAGTAAAAAGLAGTYSLNATRSTVTYDATGLSFPGLQTSGGAVTLHPTGGATSLSVELAPQALLTSTNLYGGYLVNIATLTATSIPAVIVGDKNAPQAYDSRLQIYAAAGGYKDANEGQITLYPENKTYYDNHGAPLSAGKTYLVLFHVSGVNRTSGPVYMEEWILSNPQYRHFAAHLTRGVLNRAALGAAADAVTEKGFIGWDHVAGHPYFNVGSAKGDGHYLTLFDYGSDATIDEIRLSARDLAAVAPRAKP